MSSNFERSIKFVIPGQSGSPSVEIYAVERDGGLQFEVQLLNVKSKAAQLSGLFMDFNQDSKLAGLNYTGSNVSNFKTGSVLDLGNGTNMQGQASPFDIGLKFGTSGIGKDSAQAASFFLFNPTQPLTLDDIANVDFGVRLAGLGNLGKSGDSAKLTVVAPAAPDARDDSYQIFEDGQTGLNTPSHAPEGIVFQVLANDSDADGDVLTITDIQGASHGIVSIIDGDDTEVGDALRYTPFEDYSGNDAFYYAISDGNGGKDFSRVDVQIDAVADVPELEVEILEGSSVNQLVLRVSASQTDADISEFIDRIEITGLPDTVSIDGALFDPASEDAALSHDFNISLPAYADSNFDLTVTTFAKEKSNGDEESASRTLNINYEYTHNEFAHTFEIEKQSMWSTSQAWSFTDNRFLGVDSETGGRLNASVGVGSAYAIYDIDYKFGLQSMLNISSGEVDASVPYSVQIETLYNETTDWLRFETDQWLDLSNASFVTRSPLLSYILKVVADVQTDLTFGADISIPGIPEVTDPVFGETVIPAIPGWSWGDSTTTRPGFSVSPTLLEFDGDSLNLLGLEGDSALNIDLGHGLSIDAAIPHYDTVSSVVGDRLESSGSASFLTLNADMDEIVAMLMGIPNPVSRSISFGPAEVNFDLLNYVLSGSMGVGQDFAMDFGNVNGTLIFEDGHEHDFIFGSDFDVHNASRHDADGNGILEFSLFIDPQATFSSDFLLTLELAHQLQILAAEMSVSVPLFDDPEFDFGTAYEYQGILAATDIKVVGMPSFDFNLGETNEIFSV